MGSLDRKIEEAVQQFLEHRLLADYMDDSVEVEMAEKMVHQAGVFMDAVKVVLGEF